MNETGESGFLLRQIAEIVARDVDLGQAGALLYAEASFNSVGAAVLQDLGDRVAWRDTEWDLFDLIQELWNTAENDEKWSSLQLAIEGDQFNAVFGYEDYAKEKEDGFTERKTALLKQRFGEKPVEYPDGETLNDRDGVNFTLGQ